MPRIAYVNGRYVRHADAAVHIEDRGYQFADGVYEVCEVARGYIVDMTRHLDRLNRSLSELQIDWPMARAALQLVMREVVRRNRVHNGLVYLQVTRGVAPRDHAFPGPGVKPALVVTAKRSDPAAATKKAETGLSVITVPENRWDRVDIKTIGLLPNVLARQKARSV
ncbi:aminotransferase class IV, partial [Rhizobiaceae sp. 2RAB30]